MLKMSLLLHRTAFTHRHLLPPGSGVRCNAFELFLATKILKLIKRAQKGQMLHHLKRLKQRDNKQQRQRELKREQRQMAETDGRDRKQRKTAETDGRDRQQRQKAGTDSRDSMSIIVSQGITDILFHFQSNKPQMEKKRRERINNSLDELKLLILGAMKKDVSNQKCTFPTSDISFKSPRSSAIDTSVPNISDTIFFLLVLLMHSSLNLVAKKNEISCLFSHCDTVKEITRICCSFKSYELCCIWMLWQVSYETK